MRRHVTPLRVLGTSVVLAVSHDNGSGGASSTGQTFKPSVDKSSTLGSFDQVAINDSGTEVTVWLAAASTHTASLVLGIRVPPELELCRNPTAKISPAEILATREVPVGRRGLSSRFVYLGGAGFRGHRLRVSQRA